MADFVLESREHLTSIEQRILMLERDPADTDAIHSVFRGFHSIKGLAGFLEFAPIQEVAHEVETALNLVREGKLAIAGRSSTSSWKASTISAGRLPQSSQAERVNARPSHDWLLRKVRALMDAGRTVFPRQEPTALPDVKSRDCRIDGNRHQTAGRALPSRYRCEWIRPSWITWWTWWAKW